MLLLREGESHEQGRSEKKKRISTMKPSFRTSSKGKKNPRIHRKFSTGEHDNANQIDGMIIRISLNENMTREK